MVSYFTYFAPSGRGHGEITFGISTLKPHTSRELDFYSLCTFMSVVFSLCHSHRIVASIHPPFPIEISSPSLSPSYVRLSVIRCYYIT